MSRELQTQETFDEILVNNSVSLFYNLKHLQSNVC